MEPGRSAADSADSALKSVAEYKAIKKELDQLRDRGGNVKRITSLLRDLSGRDDVDYRLLLTTGIGKTVNKLTTHRSAKVTELALPLLQLWRLIDEATSREEKTRINEEVNGPRLPIINLDKAMFAPLFPTEFMEEDFGGFGGFGGSIGDDQGTSSKAISLEPPRQASGPPSSTVPGHIDLTSEDDDSLPPPSGLTKSKLGNTIGAGKKAETNRKDSETSKPAARAAPGRKNPAATAPTAARPPAAKKAKPAKAYTLIWVCHWGKCGGPGAQNRPWRKKDLNIVGIYATKAAAEQVIY